MNRQIDWNVSTDLLLSLCLSVCVRWRVTLAACGAVRWRSPRWSAAPRTGHCVCGTPRAGSACTRCTDTHPLCAACTSTAIGNAATHFSCCTHAHTSSPWRPERILTCRPTLVFYQLLASDTSLICKDGTLQGGVHLQFSDWPLGVKMSNSTPK